VTTRGTPSQVISLLNRHVNSMMDDAGYQKLLSDGGLDAMRDNPEQFAARISRDNERLGKLVKTIGLQAQ
jgi:tripartite-type tricarboxylate transporter receptor subunit TctC